MRALVKILSKRFDIRVEEDVAILKRLRERRDLSCLSISTVYQPRGRLLRWLGCEKSNPEIARDKTNFTCAQNDVMADG
jgi:hypothetical protein